MFMVCPYWAHITHGFSGAALQGTGIGKASNRSKILLDMNSCSVSAHAEHTSHTASHERRCKRGEWATDALPSDALPSQGFAAAVEKLQGRPARPRRGQARAQQPPTPSSSSFPQQPEDAANRAPRAPPRMAIPRGLPAQLFLEILRAEDAASRAPQAPRCWGSMPPIPERPGPMPVHTCSPLPRGPSCRTASTPHP